MGIDIEIILILVCLVSVVEGYVKIFLVCV